MSDDVSPAPESARELGSLLLDAKLSAPHPRPGAVSRGEVIETARSSGCRVVGITAPAGYGKSTLLAEWAQVEDRRVAWVSLDRFDNDPAILLASLAAAYGRIDPGRADLIADVSGLGVSVLGRAAPRLASVLNASPVPFVLILDDLHELSSPACHDVLGVVISGIPRGSQLVAASRAEQPHLPRLRVLGDAVEFVAGDLALDAAGAQQIFFEEHISLSPEHAAAVTERTEGWPAGLYLAALIAKETNGEAQAVTGDDHYVADYLYGESLTQQPEDIQRFLRHTAVLDQLSGPLCDRVVGSSNAPELLHHVAASCLFLIPLDRRREWYRYHAMFREFLLGELRRTEPDVIAKLHLRAADWYESNGSSTLALEHLLNTAERDRSLQLVTEMALSTYNAGQMSTVQHWLAAIGDADIERYPPLAVIACWASVLTGETRDALRWAALVDAASFDLVPADGSASFDSARAMLRAVMCVAGPETMMASATFAVAQEPEWSPWRDTALWLLAEAQLLAGNLDEAGSLLAESSAYAATVGNTDSIVVCESMLALLAMDRGDWREAAVRLELALTTIDEQRMHDYVMSLLAFAGAAKLSLHHGDLNDAHRQLARAMRARPTSTYALPFLAVQVRLELAKVYLAMADPTTARHLLREIDDILIHRPALGTLTEEVEKLRCALASSAAAGATAGPPLTPAELRLLPYLQTHLTVREVAGRLFVSPNTVRSQVRSIYRKLGVSSRGDAVEHATALGLLGA